MSHVIHMQGSIFRSDASVLAHGVNAAGEMDSGIAPVFKAMHPRMFEMYRDLCLSGALVPGGIFPWSANEDQQIILNLVTQDKPKANARLSWLDESLRTGLGFCDQFDLPLLAIPRIGCGVGGLSYEDVLPIVESAASDYRCNIELWTRPSH